MPTQIDHEESELLQAFEQGQLKSVASKSELATFKVTARATVHQTLADRRQFSLSDPQWDEFQQALDQPVQIKPRLKNLLSTPGVLGESNGFCSRQKIQAADTVEAGQCERVSRQRRLSSAKFQVYLTGLSTEKLVP